MKKALDAAAVIATITIAGWNYQQNKEIELSDLAMEIWKRWLVEKTILNQEILVIMENLTLVNQK